ncbi:hypothetical protein CTAYLR_006135 [Chrysophaeum taylorii]|uniref:EamA domain-containing protein n=1 Tax=Chrysophaeum taylorii TaxID=2483200 RepID=A0AAD7UP92_9STRA|nr:hypothetical protein CTAYLR_006135 [Chrysophaeum taylorii]
MLIAFVGVMSATPEGAILRWGKEFLIDGEAPLLFWKNAFTCLFGAVLSALLDREHKEVSGRRILKGWPFFALAVACQGFIAISFPLAFLYTYAANVIVLFSLTPLFSAILGWVLLDDALPRRTVLALVAATASITVMFVRPSGERPGHVFGDVLALVTGLVNSIFLVSVRAGLRRVPDLPTPLASSIGTALGAVAALGWGNVCDVSSPVFFAPMLLDGFSIGIILVAFSIAPRYVSAGEIGLVSLLEIVFTPGWVFLCFGEIPPEPTILGGAALLVIIACHEWASLRADRLDYARVAPDRRDLEQPEFPAIDDTYATFKPQRAASTT